MSSVTGDPIKLVAPLLAAGVYFAQDFSMDGVRRYVAARDWQGLLR